MESLITKNGLDYNFQINNIHELRYYSSKLWIMIGWKTIGNFLSQRYHQKCWRNFWKRTLKTFSWMRENDCKKWLHKNFTLATDDAIEDLKNGAKNTNTMKSRLYFGWVCGRHGMKERAYMYLWKSWNNNWLNSTD